MDLKNKKILICGMGISGLSIASYLQKKHYNFYVLENKPTDAIRDKFDNKLITKNIDDKLLDKFDVVFMSPGFVAQPATLKKYKDKITSDIALFATEIKKPIIAITGTNGKSTVVKMIEHCINRQNKKAVACGNIGIAVLDTLKKPPYDYYILEVSSFQLDLCSDFHKEISVVLNIAPDHLDRYDSYKSYQKSKLSIFKNSQEGFVFHKIKYDEKDNVHKFGGAQNDYKIVNGIYWINNAQIKAKNKNKITQINQLITLSVLDRLNFNLQQANDDLLDFSPLKFRLEHIATYKNSKWFNDSKATNAAATIAALLSFKEKIVLIAGGSKKDEDYKPLHKVLKEKCGCLILYGQTAKEIAKIAAENKKILVKNLKEAVDIAFRECKGRLDVLFSPACASFDMFLNFQHRGEVFNDMVYKKLDTL
jgi:UDP-N-acetylmuramoylalanine--D-glutamate ligase